MTTLSLRTIIIRLKQVSCNFKNVSLNILVSLKILHLAKLCNCFTCVFYFICQLRLWKSLPFNHPNSYISLRKIVSKSLALNCVLRSVDLECVISRSRLHLQHLKILNKILKQLIQEIEYHIENIFISYLNSVSMWYFYFVFFNHIYFFLDVFRYINIKDWLAKWEKLKHPWIFELSLIFYLGVFLYLENIIYDMTAMIPFDRGCWSCGKNCFLHVWSLTLRRNNT